MKHIALGLIGLFAACYISACKSNNLTPPPPTGPGYVNPTK